MKKIVIFLILLAIILVPSDILSAKAESNTQTDTSLNSAQLTGNTQSDTSLQSDKSESDVEQDLNTSIEDLLNNLDIKDLEEYLDSLTDEQLKAFGASRILHKLKKIISGEESANFSSIIGYVLNILGVNILHYAPLILSIIAIALAFNIINSLKGKFASESVENIVNFAAIALVTILVFTQIYLLIGLTTRLIGNIQKQISIFFPILLTLMTAIGAGSSVSVYQPGVAILSAGIAELMTVIILPCFILSVVFSVVGSLSDGIKLKKMSGFFESATKWMLTTTFFVFVAILSVQGITASVYDGISVRTARFAISKYIPLIGGYLSEGFNLVLAGSVLIKNAVGLTAVILLLVTVIPTVLQIIIFNLSLKLAGAVVEPLGDSRISNMVTNVGKSVNILVAIVVGLAFLYFIFLILIVVTGNLAL